MSPPVASSSHPPARTASPVASASDCAHPGKPAAITKSLPLDSLQKSASPHAPLQPLPAQKALETFRDYWRGGANRDILKALAWKYLPGVALSALLLLPLGWMLAAVGLVPVWLMARKGERMVEKLLTSGKLSNTQGPLARITAINALWQTADNAKGVGTPEKIRKELNLLLQDIFAGEPGSDAARLSGWLRLRSEGRLFDGLKQAFHARRYYVGTTVGKVCCALSNWGSRIPIVPLHVLFRLPELVTMPLVSVFSLSHIRALAHAE